MNLLAESPKLFTSEEQTGCHDSEKKPQLVCEYKTFFYIIFLDKKVDTIQVQLYCRQM